MAARSERDYYLHVGKQRELVLAQQNIIRLHWKMEGRELELNCHLAMSLSYNCFSKQNFDHPLNSQGYPSPALFDFGALETGVGRRFKKKDETLFESFLARRSEEHTSELQSLMRISYAVFCLKKKNTRNTNITHRDHKKKKTKQD